MVLFSIFKSSRDFFFVCVVVVDVKYCTVHKKSMYVLVYRPCLFVPSTSTRYKYKFNDVIIILLFFEVQVDYTYLPVPTIF